MFPEAATQSSTYSKTMCCTFFLSEAVVHLYLSEAVLRSLKNIEIHLEAATNLLKLKKYIQKQLHKFLHGFYTKSTHLVLKIFHNGYENIYDGY